MVSILYGGGYGDNRRHISVLAIFKNIQKQLAFTLAEVLITLGIIGIVAAMVIPSLISSYQKHVTVTRLKQTYAQITQAVKLSEADNGNLGGWDMAMGQVGNYTYDSESSKKFAQTYFTPYLKYSYVCDDTKSYCSYSKKQMDNSTAITSNFEKLYGIVLMNGVVIRFWPRVEKAAELKVDLNGSSGPNTAGKDIFSIVVSNGDLNGVLGKEKAPGVYMSGVGYSREYLMSGGTHQHYACSKTPGRLYSGTFCGALIQLDGWKISKDYPW